jgi:uncharacterized protein
VSSNNLAISMHDVIPPLISLPLFFIVAMMYASVGHGGASGYLALFAVLGIAAPEIVPTALMLNILVASMGFYQYRRMGHFDLKILLPFVVASIPAAFIGGLIQLPREAFYIILGAALLLSSWRLLYFKKKDSGSINLSPKKLWLLGLPIGASLGFLAGMIGIGGGVFLSPLLLLLHWADAKKTAAISAAFIVLNSISGLAGQLSRISFNPIDVLPLAIVVGLGGYVGARTGAVNLKPKTVRFVLAVVLVMAGTKLIAKALFI